MLVRDAAADDAPALAAALVEAVNWDGQVRFTRDQVLADPHLAHYVTDWPRPGDFGVVAVHDSAAAEGEVLGAAWCRVFEAEDPGFGYLGDDIPEVSIGVAPAHRGRGIGGALLAALVEQARERGHRVISLSVEDGNRARSLYQRTGFVAVARTGGSDTMRLDLPR